MRCCWGHVEVDTSIHFLFPTHSPHLGCSLFELDLHGLHTGEALAALERRLALLQSVVHDAAMQPQDGPARGQNLAASEGKGAAQSRTQAGGVAEPLRVVTAAAPLVKGRAQLRVIVGRGTHSSGGEASLPRAVEGRLTQLGYRYVRGTGALDVQLWRPYSGSAAAARDM